MELRHLLRAGEARVGAELGLEPGQGRDKVLLAPEHVDETRLPRGSKRLATPWNRRQSGPANVKTRFIGNNHVSDKERPLPCREEGLGSHTCSAPPGATVCSGEGAGPQDTGSHVSEPLYRPFAPHVNVAVDDPPV